MSPAPTQAGQHPVKGTVFTSSRQTPEGVTNRTHGSRKHFWGRTFKNCDK
jgi:hypothetical protein